MAINTRFITLGMVSFVDLLGFSERVMAMRQEEELEAIEADVRRVQEWFEHRPGDKHVKQSQNLRSKKVLAFSDCLVISVSSYSESTKWDGDFDVLMNEVADIAMAQGRCVMNGIFIRGASEYGLWYKRRDTMISPAMVTAYNLEHAACVPMIAIAADLMQHLSEHPHRKFYSDDSDPIEKYFRHYDDLPNGTSQWFIDYLPICLEAADGAIAANDRKKYTHADAQTRDRMRNEAYTRDCQEMVTWHRDAILAAHAIAASDTVRAKYVWLAAYHDDAVGRFFVDPSSDLLIGQLL